MESEAQVPTLRAKQGCNICAKLAERAAIISRVGAKQNEG